MRLNFTETRLPNGTRVATAGMPNVESVAIGVWVGVGGIGFVVAGWMEFPEQRKRRLVAHGFFAGSDSGGCGASLLPGHPVARNLQRGIQAGLVLTVLRQISWNSKEFRPV